jgi:hypothetical protein
LLDGYLSMPYLFHTQRSSAELIRNTYQGTGKLVSGIVLPVLSIGTEMLLGIALLATLIVLAPQAMLITTVALAVVDRADPAVVQPRLVELRQRFEVRAARASLRSSRRSAASGTSSCCSARTPSPRSTCANAPDREGRLPLEPALAPLAARDRDEPDPRDRGRVHAHDAGDLEVERTLATLAVFAYVGLRIQPILGHIIGFFNTMNKNRRRSRT